MGCVFSRTYDTNPRVFHVWNVDSDLQYLKPGKIEVTDSQLILYQKPNLVVQWPLTWIRRYGFDSEIFSFESGRRCTTGAGVYAFKCKRAQQLFTILQECINKSGGGATSTNNNSTLVVVPADNQSNSVTPSQDSERVHLSLSSLPNGSVHVNSPVTHAVDSAGYLEPITANSYTEQPSRRDSHVPAGSPGSYVCIHSTSDALLNEGASSSDWPNVPRSYSSCCSLGGCATRTAGASQSAHHYVNNDVIQQNGCSNSMCLGNHYVNASVIHDQCCHEQTPRANAYVNSSVVTMSTGHLPCSCTVSCSQCVDINTNYAKLDSLLKQEQSAKQLKDQHCYVNVKPDVNDVSGRSSPTEEFRSVIFPASPGSLKGCCFVNSPTGSEMGLTRDQDQVNYAVLDLDQTEANSASAVVSPVAAQTSVLSVAGSPARSPEGYAQIDFDKTKALSNSSNPCTAFTDDSIRKTRHNAAIPCCSSTA